MTAVRPAPTITARPAVRQGLRAITLAAVPAEAAEDIPVEEIQVAEDIAAAAPAVAEEEDKNH